MAETDSFTVENRIRSCERRYSNWTSGSGFDYSVAASGSDNAHQRDFIFHVTKDTSTSMLFVGGSNNTNFIPREVAHVVLFSNDLALSYDLVIDYYRLRFQIEFNFRDAKQHWGLEDFMVVNSANMAMFMVNVSQALMRPMRSQWPELSVNDLKTWFRSREYVVETLKLLPEIPEAIFIDQAIDQVAQLGRINHSANPA